MTKEQMTDYRNRLNELHNEMQFHIDIDWNKILIDDVSSRIPFDMNVDNKEIVRRGRHVLHLLESCIDNIDLMLELTN